jgi:hypothetical protein
MLQKLLEDTPESLERHPGSPSVLKLPALPLSFDAAASQRKHGIDKGESCI